MNQIRKGKIVSKKKFGPNGPYDVFYQVEQSGTAKGGVYLKQIVNGKLTNNETFTMKHTLTSVKVGYIEVSSQELKRIKTQYYPGWVEHTVSKQWDKIIEQNPKVIKFYNGEDYVYCIFTNARKFIRKRYEKLMEVKEIWIKINAEIII